MIIPAVHQIGPTFPHDIPSVQGFLSRQLGLDEFLQDRAIQPRGGPGATDLVCIQGPPETSGASFTALLVSPCLAWSDSWLIDA